MLAKICFSRARTTCGHSTLIVLILKDRSLTSTLSMLAVSLWTENKSSLGSHTKTSSLKFFSWVKSKTCAESAPGIFCSHKKIGLLCGFFPRVPRPVLTQGASVLILNVPPWWGQRQWQQCYWFEGSLLQYTTKPESTLNNNKSINRWPTTWWNSIPPLGRLENEIPEEGRFRCSRPEPLGEEHRRRDGSRCRLRRERGRVPVQR